MSKITVAQVLTILAATVAAIKGLEYLYTKFISWADNWLERGIKPVHDKIDNIETKFKNRLDDLDTRLIQEEIETMRPELMRMLSLADRGHELSEFEKKHLQTLKKEYNKKGGDSYIDDYYERLQKEGKL